MGRASRRRAAEPVSPNHNSERIPPNSANLASGPSQLAPRIDVPLTVSGAVLIPPQDVGPKYIIVSEKSGPVDHHKGVDDGVLDASGSQQLSYSSTPYVPAGDFAAMDYPIAQHLHNTAGATYVYADPNYPTGYYQYQPTNVHSPQHSYVMQQHHQQQQSPGSIDDDSNALGHAARASPETQKWLTDNYEPFDSTSLPRCTLYDHYKKHCSEINIDPVNAASFGKLIRSVFQNLKTRRLGTRGNSKYHYYGIRIRKDSPLNRQPLEDYGRDGAVTRSNQSTARRPSSRTALLPTNNNSFLTASHQPPPPQPADHYNGEQGSSFNGYENNRSSVSPAVPDADLIVLGEGAVPQLMPNLTGIEETLRMLKMNTDHVMRFADTYAQNCQEILYSIKQLQFDQIEECWTSFWQPERDDMDDDGKYGDYFFCTGKEDRLSQQQIFSLCTVPQIQEYIVHMDYSFYQVLVDVLLVDVLSTAITAAHITSVRNFAKSLENQLRKAMMGAPDMVIRKKCDAVRLFSQTLRRYTSLNHLATAARGVLQKPDQIQQMINDFNRVEISSVQEQAGWVCACDPLMVQHLQSAFRDNLQQQKSLSEWAEWMEAVVDNVLAKYHDKSVETLGDVAKQFLLNWSFYCSCVIRDLTLRSAQSFGSFHLLRLLFDEYMLYLVEQRLAKAAARPAVSIMANNIEWNIERLLPGRSHISVADVGQHSLQQTNKLSSSYIPSKLNASDEMAQIETSSPVTWKVIESQQKPEPDGIIYMEEPKPMYVVSTETLPPN